MGMSHLHRRWRPTIAGRPLPTLQATIPAVPGGVWHLTFQDVSVLVRVTSELAEPLIWTQFRDDLWWMAAAVAWNRTRQAFPRPVRLWHDPCIGLCTDHATGPPWMAEPLFATRTSDWAADALRRMAGRTDSPLQELDGILLAILLGSPTNLQAWCRRWRQHGTPEVTSEMSQRFRQWWRHPRGLDRRQPMCPQARWDLQVRIVHAWCTLRATCRLSIRPSASTHPAGR